MYVYACHIPTSNVKSYSFPGLLIAVTVLDTEIVCVTNHDTVSVYLVHECHLQLLATAPLKSFYDLASCLYTLNESGFLLASHDGEKVHISVTSKFNRYWVEEVKEIVYNSRILPFCRDVHNIVFQYL